MELKSKVWFLKEDRVQQGTVSAIQTTQSDNGTTTRYAIEQDRGGLSISLGWFAPENIFSSKEDLLASL